MRKRVFIADIKSHRKEAMTGHYISVARNYKEVLGERYDVVIAGCETFRQGFKDEEMLKLPYANNGNYKRSKLETFLNSIVLFWKARGSIIVLQQSTSITSFICILFFYWMTSDLYVIQYDTDSIRSKIGKMLWFLMRWKVKGLICPSERIGMAYGIDYLVVTDYIFAQGYILPVPYEYRKWDFSAVGNITKDKGTLEIVDFLASQGKKVLIAGRIAEPELEPKLTELLNKYPNLEHHIGFVAKEDYINYIRYSKYCLLNYTGRYHDRSSGVVLDIIFNGTPVLGAKCEALSIIEKYDIGLLYHSYFDINFNLLFNRRKYENLLNQIIAYGFVQSDYKQQIQSFISN